MASGRQEGRGDVMMHLVMLMMARHADSESGWNWIMMQGYACWLGWK